MTGDRKKGEGEGKAGRDLTKGRRRKEEKEKKRISASPLYTNSLACLVELLIIAAI